MFFNNTQKYINLEKDNLILEKDNEDLLITNNQLKYEKNELEKKYDRLHTFKETGFKQHIFLGKKLYKRQDKVKIYASSCRTLFPNLSPWDYNRPIDENHKLKLKEIILKKRFLEGYFDIIKCDDNLAIVNGQHRYSAILDIMKEDHLFDMEIFCNVHEVKGFDSEEATKIFLSTNNIKNVKLSDNPQKKLMNVCERLMKQFPDGIKSNKSETATLHRIDKKELYNTMQMNEKLSNDDMSEDDLYDKMIVINNKLSLKPYKDLFKSKSSRNIKMWEGAHKSGFFIGLKKGAMFGMFLLNEC